MYIHVVICIPFCASTINRCIYVNACINVFTSFIHIYTYFCVYICKHINVYMFTYLHTHTYIYIYIDAYLHAYIYIYIHTYIFNTHVFICIYKNMYTHTYIYIYDILWNDDIWIFSTMNFHERWWFDHRTWWSFIIVYRIHPISTIMMRYYLKLFRGFQSHGGTPLASSKSWMTMT